MPDLAFDIVCLEDDPNDWALIEKVERPLSRRLQEHFEVEWAGVIAQCPIVQIHLTRCATTSEFVDLLTWRGVGQGDGDRTPRALILVILDLLVPPSPDTTEASHLADQRVPTKDSGETRPFADWFRHQYPATPAMILTSLGFEDARQEEGALLANRSHYTQKEKLANPDDFARVIASELLVPYWSTPFWTELREYAANTRHEAWHTPGHNAGNSLLRSAFLRPFHDKFARAEEGPALAFSSDLSVSVDRLGDLSEPLGHGPIAQAMEHAAEVFGARTTFFATNGTSTSNKVMLMTLLRPGEAVLLDRNCHKSVHQAVVFSGALPVYLSPEYHRDLGCWLPLSLDTLQSVLQEDSFLSALEPRLLVLTTCTYEGLLYPIDEIATECAGAGVLLYADEAWFPYGRFHPRYAQGPSRGRYNALGWGAPDHAHFAVQSTHKVLSALSQGSMIHVGHALGRAFESGNRFGWLRDRFGTYSGFLSHLAEVARYWLSTSPNYPIIASLDCATRQVAGEGYALVDQLLHYAEELRAFASRFGAAVEKADLVGTRPEFRLFEKDPLKFMVAVKPGRTATGETHLEALKAILEQEGQGLVGVTWEKSSGPATNDDLTPLAAGGHMLFLLTAGISKDHVENLKAKLQAGKDHLGWSRESSRESSWRPSDRQQVVVLPRDAHYAIGREASLEEALEMEETDRGSKLVSCQMVVPYPPGIPTILPGMPVSEIAAKNILDLHNARDKGARTGEIHGLIPGHRKPTIRVMTESEVASTLQRYTKAHEAYLLARRERAGTRAGYVEEEEPEANPMELLALRLTELAKYERVGIK